MRFGEISGLRINWAKSIIFPLTPAMTPIELDYPLQWSSNPVRYLGVQVHMDSELVFNENYGKAITRLEEDIDQWICLPLLLMGRISLMKMIVLPRFLFLFQNSPMALLKHMFKIIRPLLVKLAWAGKHPRVKWDILTLLYPWEALVPPI